MDIFGQDFERDDIERIFKLAYRNLPYSSLREKVRSVVSEIEERKYEELRNDPNYRKPVL